MLTALLVLLLTATGAAAVVPLRRPRPGGTRRADPSPARTSRTALGVLSALAFVAVASQVTLELGRPSQASQERAVPAPAGTVTGGGAVRRGPVTPTADPSSDEPQGALTTTPGDAGTPAPAPTDSTTDPQSATSAATAPTSTATAPAPVTPPTTPPATSPTAPAPPTPPAPEPSATSPERTKKPHPGRPSRSPR